MGIGIVSEYNWDRLYVGQEEMALFEAIDSHTARMYGQNVRAAEFSNVDYKVRFGEFSKKLRMNPPPSCRRIFPGYLVIRKLGTPDKYETWMPDHVFEELYRKPGGDKHV